jgi:hypothetical protein
MIFISKEQFLQEHNKLSPQNLQADLVMLNRFKEEKKLAIKDDAWCLDKMRVPFISWLTSMQRIKEHSEKKPTAKKIAEKVMFRNYPETHYEN